MIQIANKQVGPGQPVYMVAELSANHGQRFDDAVELIRQAALAGADAVKTQTYTPESLTLQSDQPCFRHGHGSLWAGQTLYELYQKAYTPWDWMPQLQQVAHENQLDFFSSPFDETAVEYLEKLDMPVYKVASFELVDIPLLRRIAATRKPVIMSTGMATLGEIEEAINVFREQSIEDVVLLKCTSGYPTPPEEMNLATIPHLAQAFGLSVGLSDHTLGISVPIAAVALGACMIEKHFTLSRNNDTPDNAFSLEPHEFRAMVEAIRQASTALGRVSYDVTSGEKASRAFRRSLFIVEDMAEGEVFSTHNVRSIRPANGLHTRYLPQVLGRYAVQPIAKGTPLRWDLVS